MPGEDTVASPAQDEKLRKPGVPSPSVSNQSPTVRKPRTLTTYGGASADDLAEQKKENERLRLMLAQEKHRRIHRVNEVRRSLSPPHGAFAKSSVARSPSSHAVATQGARSGSEHLKKDSTEALSNAASIQQQPLLSASGPPHTDDGATQQRASPSDCGHASPKLSRTRQQRLSPLRNSYYEHHPLSVDQSMPSPCPQRAWERKKTALRTREGEDRATITAEERRNFLLVHRVLRLLRKSERTAAQQSQHHARQAEARETLEIDELRARLLLLCQVDRFVIHRFMIPLEDGARNLLADDESAKRRTMWHIFKKEQRVWHAVALRQNAVRNADRVALFLRFMSERLSLVEAYATATCALHDAHTAGRESVRQAHQSVAAHVVEEKRRKRAEAFEAEMHEEKIKKQIRQKAIEAKHQEEKKVAHAWAEWESLRIRMLRAEGDMWMLLMRMFRLGHANVLSFAKLRRVEGYFNDALHEMPTIGVSQSLHAAPSVAYASQIAPPQPQLQPPARIHSPVGAPALRQKRCGMLTASSYRPPVRRDQEDLPKYLKLPMTDETSPLFVGSFNPHGGMLLDPSAEVSVDMGESWGARLLVCWSYAQEQTTKIARQAIRRLLGGIRAAEVLAEHLSDEAALKKLSSKKVAHPRLGRSSSTFAETQSELSISATREVCEIIPQWILTWRQELVGEVRRIRARFPAVALPIGSSPLDSSLVTHRPPDDALVTIASVASPDDPTNRKLYGYGEAMATNRMASASMLSVSAECTPQDSSLPAGGDVSNKSFVLDVQHLTTLRNPLIEMKAAKERVVCATITLQSSPMPADIFADRQGHCPLLFVQSCEVEELQRVHSSLSVVVQQSPDQPSTLTMVVRRTVGASGGYVSPFEVRDAVRLVRIQVVHDIDEWRIPTHGIGISVDVTMRCRIASVPSHISVATVSSLHDVVSEILEADTSTEHEVMEELQCFLMPYQLHPHSSRELAAGAMPVHDCRTNRPCLIAPHISLRLIPRLERIEEVTTEVEGWNDNQSFSVVSRRSSVLNEAQQQSPLQTVHGLGRSESIESSSPVGSPPVALRSPLLFPQLPDEPRNSPKIRAHSPPSAIKRVASLRREVVRRRATLVVPDVGGCDYLSECEAKGLEITFSIFDGITVEDSLILDDPTRRIAWDPSPATGSGPIVVDGKEVGSAIQQLCTLRLAFHSGTPVDVVERVCRATAIKCSQFASRIGIRVVQVVLARPYDKHNAPATSKWVPPSAAYVAVQVTATDVPPTFTVADRLCYRGSFAGGGPVQKSSGVTPRTASIALASEASRIFRAEPRRQPIARDAVVSDPDTQLFCGGSLSFEIRNYEAGDHMAVDLREFDEVNGVDGLRMQFVESEAHLGGIVETAYQAMLSANNKEGPPGGGGSCGGDNDDTACAILWHDNEPIGVLCVHFRASSKHPTDTHQNPPPPRAARRQSALWGTTTAASHSTPSMLRRRKSSISFRDSSVLASVVDGAVPSDGAVVADHTPNACSGESYAWNTAEFAADCSNGAFTTDRTTEEPLVQKPLGSLIASDGNTPSAVAAMPDGPKSAPQDDSLGLGMSLSNGGGSDVSIEGVCKIVAYFDRRVVFDTVQELVRSAVYYRSSLYVPPGETLIDITVAVGPTIECFDVHGDMIAAGGGDDVEMDCPTPMCRTITVERSPPLLSVPEKDRSIVYRENSGARRLLVGKAPTLPADVPNFEGGFLRVEIAPEDLEVDDEIILDVSLEKLRRIFLKFNMLQDYFPDTIGAARRPSASVNRNSRRGTTSDGAGKQLDMRAKVTEERRRSFRTIDSVPREPPMHSGPPVAVSALRRLGSMKRLTADTAVSSCLSSSLSQPGDDSVASPPLGTSLLPPPLVLAPSRVAPMKSPTALWNKVRKDVTTASTAHRFLNHADTKSPRGAKSELYTKVFDLVRQSASSQVQIKRQAELERFGIDDAFVQRMISDAAGGGVPPNTTTTSTSDAAAATTAATTTPAATVCCLADFDENSLGTLFSRHGCLSIAFDPLLPAQVMKGHTLPVRPQAVVQQLMGCIAYRNTSRNPAILHKRITLTLVHPTSGRTVVFFKIAIDPVDDPTEITLQRPVLALRCGASEVEPYDEALVAAIHTHRQKHGVHLAMPEASLPHLPAACCPRFNVSPIMPLWSTTVFDPDTFFWNGGKIEIACTQTINDSGNGVAAPAKLSSDLRATLAQSLGVLSVEEQRILERFMCDPASAIAVAPKWFVSVRQDAASGALNTYIHEATPGPLGNGRHLGTMHAPHQLDGATVMLLTFQEQSPADEEPWITIDMVWHLLGALYVDRERLLDIMVEGATSLHSMVLPLDVSVWDSVNPVAGQTTVSIELGAPLLTWPPQQTMERKASMPAKSPAQKSSFSDWPARTEDGDFIVYASLREASAVQGEPCFQNLRVRIPERDRVGGGFIELVPLSGNRPEDRLSIVPPNNQMVVTTDGIVTSKEGNLGRVYGNNSSTSSYFRVDLAGYWFEGSKKLPATKQDATNPITVPPGIDAATGTGRITPAGSLLWSKQVAGRVTGKRLTSLIRSIYFRTEVPSGVGPSTVTGARRFQLNVSDGKYDAFGRLEVSSTILVVHVIDAMLPPRN